jgi:hypothetical protein
MASETTNPDQNKIFPGTMQLPLPVSPAVLQKRSSQHKCNDISMIARTDGL